MTAKSGDKVLKAMTYSAGIGFLFGCIFMWVILRV